MHHDVESVDFVRLGRIKLFFCLDNLYFYRLNLDLVQRQMTTCMYLCAESYLFSPRIVCFIHALVFQEKLGDWLLSLKASIEIGAKKKGLDYNLNASELKFEKKR